MDKSFLKRLDLIKSKLEEIKAQNYLPALIIRSEDEIQTKSGKIGPDTKIILIKARKERAH